MKNKERFYIDTEGNDDKAYREAMQHACKLADKDPEIKKVILLALSKQNTGWLDRLYGDNVVKRLFKGLTFENCKPLFKIETIKTYRDSYKPSEIVITLGLDESDIFKIEDYISVKSIIAIPWLPDRLQKWIKTWNPTELRGKTSATTFPEPSCIVKKAFEELTSSINMSTGISHPSDERHAKTTVLALHKYEPSLDPDIVGAYLVSKLRWETDHAQEIERLIKTLNDGKHFQGGDRTGLQYPYKRWKEECKS